MALAKNSVLVYGIPKDIGIETAKEKLTIHFQKKHISGGDDVAFVEAVEEIDLPRSVDKIDESRAFIVAFKACKGAVATALCAEPKELKIKFRFEEGKRKVQLNIQSCPSELEAAIFKKKSNDPNIHNHANEEKHNGTSSGKVTVPSKQNLLLGNEQVMSQNFAVQPLAAFSHEPAEPPIGLSVGLTMTQPMGPAPPGFTTGDMGSYSLFPETQTQNKDQLGLRHLWESTMPQDQSLHNKTSALTNQEKQHPQGDLAPQIDRAPGSRMAMRFPGSAVRQPQCGTEVESHSEQKPVDLTQSTQQGYGNFNAAGQSQYETKHGVLKTVQQQERVTGPDKRLQLVQDGGHLETRPQFDGKQLPTPPQLQGQGHRVPHPHTVQKPIAQQVQREGPPMIHPQVAHKQHPLPQPNQEQVQLMAPPEPRQFPVVQQQQNLDMQTLTGMQPPLLDAAAGVNPVMLQFMKSLSVEQQQLFLQFSVAANVPSSGTESPSLDSINQAHVQMLGGVQQPELPIQRGVAGPYGKTQQAYQRQPNQQFVMGTQQPETLRHTPQTTQEPTEDTADEEDSCTVVVTGFGTIRPDMLKVYFASEHRSGGGSVSNCEMKSEDVMVITFESPDVANRVVQKEHIMGTKTLVLKKVAVPRTFEESAGIISSSDEEMPSEEDEPLNDAVEVTGMNWGKNSLEVLQLYFESKRARGGPVKSTQVLDDGKKLLITFEDPEVVPRVLEHSHKCQDVVLTVSLPVQKKRRPMLPRDKKAILLKGVSDTTNRETIELFMENCTGIEQKPALFSGDRPGVVLLRYSQSIPNFERVIQKVAKKKLNKVNISAEAVYMTDSILVQKIPRNVSEDTICLYFESRRSGGGDVEDIVFDKEKKLAVVCFKDYKVINTVLQKSHILNNVQLDVQPYHECLGHESIEDSDRETSQLPSNRQPPDQSKEAQKMRLQDPPGGGADRAPKKEGRLEKGQKVRKRSDLPTDRSAMILKGLADGTSKENIDLYLENRSRIPETPNLLFGEEPGTVMVRYSADIPDFDGVLRRISQKSLNGARLSAVPAYQTDCILVEGLPPECSEDVLTLYFESSRRSGGGSVDFVDFDEERNAAQVFFQDYKVVENVLQKRHVINKVPLTVLPFHANLGYVISGEELTPRIPKPVTVDVDPVIVEFIMMKVRQFGEEFQQILGKAYAQIEWPYQGRHDVVVLIPALTPDTKNLHRIVKSWQKDAVDFLQQYLHRYKMVTIPVLEGIWLKVKSQVGSLATSGDPVDFQMEQASSMIFITGKVADVTKLEARVKEIIEVIEDEMQKAKQRTTESVNIQEDFKIKQLLMCRFSKEIMEKFSGLQVKIVSKARKVTFEGLPNDIVMAKVKMYETLNTLPVKKFTPPSQNIREFLQDPSVTQKIYDIFKTRGFRAAYMVQEEVICSASTEETAKQAIQILKNSVDEYSIDLKPQSLAAIQKNEWQRLVKELEDEETVYILPPQASSRNAVTVIGFKTNLLPVATKLESFIKQHTVIDEVIKMEPGRLRFIFNSKGEDLQGIRQQAKQRPFVIDKHKNGVGIVVRGTEDDVRMACQQVRKLAEQVDSRPHPIDKPGIPALFKEDKGKTYLKLVEGEFNCCIDVTDPSEVEEAMEADDEPESVPQMPPPPTLTVLCYHTMNDGRRIVVGKGDLTQMPVQAIVNGCTPQLDHSGGLAKAIVDAGGQTIADETASILRSKGGRLFPGQVVSTGAGNLPCARIIHAVGPSWNRSRRGPGPEEGVLSQEEKLLHDTVWNSLWEADRHQCRSIALPAISSGAFGFPLDLCVETIIAAVDEYCNTRPPGFLNEINLVDNADMTCKAFQGKLVEYFGSENVIIPDQFPGGYAGSVSSHRGRFRGPASNDDLLGTSLQPQSNASEVKTAEGIVIKLVKGSIAKQTTDIIVNTTQTTLALNTGGVSAAILKVAGPQLQQDIVAQKDAGADVRAGSIIVTGGAKLKCEEVYHVLCCHWNGQPNAEKLLRGLLRQCFQGADQSGMTSIAFPAIGTGGLGFPANITAKVMYEEAKKFSTSNPATSLKDIRFVIYDQDHQTYQAFKSVLQQLTGGTAKRRHSTKGDQKKNSADMNPAMHGSHASHSPLTQTLGFQDRSSHSIRGSGGEDSMYTGLKQSARGSQMMIGKICVQVQQGDITKETTDAIVNSTNVDLDLSMGGVSKAIVAAGGRTIVRECQKLQKQQADTVVMTGAGNLKCKNIIHMITPYQKLEDSIVRMLAFAEQQGLKSLTMPAVGTGALGISPAKVAHLTLEAIGDFFQQHKPQHLKLIRVTVFQPPMVQSFQQAMTNLLGKPPKDKRNVLRKAWDATFGKVHLFGASSGEAEKTWHTLILYIFAGRKTDIDGAIEKLEKLIDSEFGDHVISKDAVGKMKPEDISHIKVFAEPFQVKVEKIDTGRVVRLRLQGRIRDVVKVQDEINETLDRISEEERQRKEALMLAKNVKWMFLSDVEKFDEYDDDIIGLIEQAKMGGKRDVEFEIGDGKYRINFQKMEETDLDDMSTVPVRRELREGGVPLPPNWKNMTPNKNFESETLDPRSLEYQGVETSFKQTLQPGYNLTQIVRIERLQNQHLYRQFFIMRQTLEAKNRRGTKNERTLYHGTSADSIGKINTMGFNRSFSGKNAILYGAGTYFAVNSEFSARSAYSPPDVNGHKYIYQAKVLTGEYTVGSQNMLVPPSKNPNDPTDCYDSVVDNTANPEIFVVFNDAVAYPEYLIVFN